MEDEEAKKAEHTRRWIEMRKLDLKRERDTWCHPSACKEGDRLVVSFSRDMSAWQDLSKLVLSGNNITDGGGQTLAINLLQCPALTYIDLHDNKIGHHGGEAFISLISSCAALTYLNLDENPIDGSLIQAMTKLLKRNQLLSSGFLTAATKGDVELLQKFMARGASTRSRDVEGNTALHLSARGGHAKAVEFLFENGLSYFSRNNKNQVPEELGDLSGSKEVDRYFSKIAGEIVNTVVFREPPSIRLPSAPPLTEPLPVLHDGVGVNSQPSAPVIGEQTELNLREISKPPQIDFKKITLNNKPVASGGMGVIYKGVLQREGESSKEVAVKMLLPLQKNNEALVEAIRKEYDILGTLCHPNVVNVVGYALDDSGSFCLVMDFYPHGSLSDYIYFPKVWDMSFMLRLSYAAQVSCGLAFLHMRGLLHLDLTPENILLDNNWRAVIADFGISRELQTEHTHCSTSSPLAGKAAFIAPEIISPTEADGKTRYSAPNDVFALAVLIWSCMSRQRPFEGWNNFRIMMEVGNNQRREKIPEGIPSSLAKLIEKSWVQGALLRPTAAQISQELSEIYYEELPRNPNQQYSPCRK